ncbi:hypothetical protein [Enterococcus hirae]|uniref:hypothetical protein n=1 Tax=Enterococcus hirae TaxID=1354 RepID=UPI0013B44F78|nr:hypothetical protein [Enterococcus hirae]
MFLIHTKVKELNQMDKFTSKTVQGNGEKAKVTANIQENAEVKDQKEVNSNMPFIQQKIEEIFTLQWGIQEVEQKLEQELAAKQSFISLCKKNQNQNIEEISNKFNELNKTSGIVNPIPTFINQKLEETFLLNKRILEIHDTTEIDSKSKKSMIENLENSKDKLMDQLIKEVSEEFNKLTKEQSKQTLRSMKEIQKVKNTRQNPLSKRANSSPQKAEPDQKKSR